MTNIRERLIGFSWIPSFIVSILTGSIFFILNNPHHIPQSIHPLLQLALQYIIAIIAIGSLSLGLLSLYYDRKQKMKWKDFEKRLEKKGERVSISSKDITKSSTEFLVDSINKVDDLLWISEDGEVTITEKNLKDAQKIVLYLIGRRYAYELDIIDSPKVSSIELANKANVPYMSLVGWYVNLDDVIKKHHLEIWERYEKDSFDKYELDIENVDKAFNYVTGDEDLPDPFFVSSIDRKH